MSKLWWCAVAVGLALMTGCGARSAGDLARISSREYKTNVLAKLGTPIDVELKDGKETLYYHLRDSSGTPRMYFVLLSESGYVESYGKVAEEPTVDAGK